MRRAGDEIENDQFALRIPAAFDEGVDVGRVTLKERGDLPRQRIGQVRGVNGLVERRKPTSNHRHPARGVEFAAAVPTIGAPTIRAMPKAMIS